MWVYAIIGVILAYAIYKERQALGCPTVPNGSDCDNANGKTILGTSPSSEDSAEELMRKVRRASSFMDRWVVWRFAFILSFVATVISTFFWSGKFPTELQLASGIFVISALLYFTMNFYRYHMGRYAEENVDECLRYLARR